MAVDPPISTLQRFEVVLDGFRRLRASSPAPRLSRMAAAVDGFAKLIIDRPTSFNSLSVLRVGSDEVVHSGVLAWLLDGVAGHGQGPLFLNLLAKALGLPIVLAATDRYVVRREFSGRESIIDVCVCRPGDFLIYLENKIWAGEGLEQVDRELRDLHRTAEANGVPERRRFAIFLTPGGRSSISGDPSPWLRLSYTRLVGAFRAAASGIDDAKLAAFVSDWLETISQWGDQS